MQFRRFFIFAAVVGVLAGIFFVQAQEAEAAKATIRFWAAEYRVYFTPGDVQKDGSLGEPKVKLTIKGRASAYGGDKVDFKWTEPDAARWLPVLQVCGGGQGKLQGNISSQTDQTDRGIEGNGPIDELNCRVILK